jgi:hypothetical protein
MSTLTKPRAKKSVCRASRVKPSARLPVGIEISPVTGLAVLASRPGSGMSSREYANLAKNVL